jgi:AcrR family transcriptional regulator
MKKKEAILQAATRLFSEKGFKDTHIAEISKMTGAAEGTIFYHFHSKEGLFLSILEGFRDGIVEEFRRYSEEKSFKSGMDMVDDVVSFYLYLAGSMEDRFLLLHRHDAYELARSNPRCREYLEAIYNCLVEIFERAILLGQEDGSIADVPAKKVAMIIFAMVDALVRFNTYNLYNAGTLYDELINSCHRILKNGKI